MRPTLTDYELVQLYLMGSESAFNQLLLRHKDKVLTYISFIVKDKYLAEDFLQETFINAINQLRRGDFKNENKFCAWITRIAHNRCMDHFRKLNQKSAIITTYGDTSFRNMKAKEIPIDDYLDILKNELQIKELIALLPEVQKETIILRLFFDFNFKEIAEFSNVSISTSVARMRYALKAIQKLIKQRELEFVKIVI